MPVIYVLLQVPKGSKYSDRQVSLKNLPPINTRVGDRGVSRRECEARETETEEGGRRCRKGAVLSVSLGDVAAQYVALL